MQAIRELGQRRTDCGSQQMFPAGRLVDVWQIDEERPELVDELIEVLHARGEESDDLEMPIPLRLSPAPRATNPRRSAAP